jgi:tetratricopeptide (TPR) repeat protein
MSRYLVDGTEDVRITFEILTFCFVRHGKEERRNLMKVFQSRVFGIPLLVVLALNISVIGSVGHPALASDNALSLSAKSAKKPSAGVAVKPAANWTPAYPALFKAPANPQSAYFIDAVGSDFESFNVSAQAAATRAVQIRQVEGEYKLQPPKSQQSLNVGLRLVRLYEEQAMYIEYLRATGLTDSRYPDVVHFVRSARSQVVNTINGLLKSFPKNEKVLALRSNQLISRLKAGDPTARAEALRFVGQSRTPEQQSVAIVGIMQDYEAGRIPSSFGNLEFAANHASDPSGRAAFRYLSAEMAMGKKQYGQAVSFYQEALRDIGRFKRPDGKSGPLLTRVLFRLNQAALSRDALNVDAEVVGAMQGAGAIDFARYYSELVALNNIAKQPGRAAKIYVDVQGLGEYSKSFNALMELRVLDIHLGARDLIAGQAQWQRVVKVGDLLGQQIPARILYTQGLALAQAQAKLDGESVARFVSLHDFFVESSQEYAAREDWTLKVIELLWRSRRASDVATRADALAGQTKNRDTLLSALRYSLRARESLLGIPAEPKLTRNRKLSGNQEIAEAYVVTLDKMKNAVTGPELEQSVYQAAYVTHLIGQESQSKQRFETALVKFSRSRYAGESVSYLLETSESGKDWLYVEKIARLALKSKITAAKAQHKNLQVIVENAVYSHAQQLSAQGQFEASANRFVAFQREFSKHKNAATALDLAARNFLQAKKTDAAITQMESLLKNYPSSGYVKETLWQAGELSRGIAQFLRAAKHYEDFAKKYPQDGIKRSAWLKSAEMHKSLGRFANAVAHYENYLGQLNSPAEKLKIAREIADTHFKFGRPAEAIAAYERMMKFVTSPDDEIYLRSQIMTIQIRQGIDSASRKTATRLLSLKPVSQEGIRIQAKAKYNLAYLDAPALRSRNVQNEKNLPSAIRTVVSEYDRTKALFLAVCEVPGSEFCSAGYYEAARMAEEIAKMLFAVELPPTLNPADVDGIRAAISKNAERLQQESKSFAAQAEQALSSGAPDAETAERIKTYAQQVRGESSDAAPLQ